MQIRNVVYSTSGGSRLLCEEEINQKIDGLYYKLHKYMWFIV